MTARDDNPHAAASPAPQDAGGEAGRPADPASALRWGMITFAFLATLINYLDRQTLSFTISLVSEEFGMSNETYGWIQFAFFLAYTVMNGVSGPLLDRLGARLGYAACMVWWSTAAVLHAATRGALSLGLFRFLLGSGEAGNWPAATKVVSEWFPARERALASGIFNSGAAVGTILSALVVPRVVLRIGWRMTFAAIGGLGYVWLAAWWFLYYTPAHVRQEVSRPPAPPWRLLRTRFLACFMVSCALLDPVWYFYIFWFPKFLKDVHGFDLVAAGNTAWIPFATAAAGNWLGGWFTGRLIGRGMSVSAARKTGISVAASLMTAAIPGVLTPHSGLAVAMISVATFGYTFFVANSLAFPAEVFPRNLVASAYGLASMGSGLGGMLLCPLEGMLIDRYGYVPVFMGCGVLPLAAAAIVLFLMGPLRPHPAFAAHASPST